MTTLSSSSSSSSSSSWRNHMATALSTASRVAIRGAPSTRHAAVLVSLCTLLERGPSRPHLLFTKRSGRVGTHKHQVSFPGGRFEAGEDARLAALRETHEEIGVDPAGISVLGTLSDCYSITREIVTPVVGVIDAPLSLHSDVAALDFARRFAPLRISEDEIDDVMIIPIDQLVDPRLVHWSDLGVGAGVVPIFRAGRHDVWGLTAMITRTFLQTVGLWNIEQPRNGSFRSRGE